VICLENIKEIYDLIPYIIMIGIILNITGNLIKMTFKVPSKYIVWILLILSLLINFIFYGFTFESLFVGFAASFFHHDLLPPKYNLSITSI
jgi:K+-sensing histidine kinase KdpD